MCQVKRRCRQGECLIIAHNSVYDATEFLKSHPAGPRAIISKAGQDCTTDFDFHSISARKEIWRPLKVGAVGPCTVHGPMPSKSRSEALGLLTSVGLVSSLIQARSSGMLPLGMDRLLY